MEPRSLALLLAEGSLLESQRSVTLRGRQATSYLRMVLALLSESRLNRSFPDRRAVQGLFRLLAPDGSHHVYDHVRVGVRTGLPTEPMVTRVQTDRELAAQVIDEEEVRNPGVRELGSVHSEPDDDLFLRRYRYHRAVQRSRVQPSFELRFVLQRVAAEQEKAHFVATLDRFDLSEELFVRYSIHLAHRSERWRRSQIHLEGHDLEATEGFRNSVARHTAHDAELAFLLLSEVPGVEVESVSRCRIGPLYAAGFNGPPPVQKIMQEHAGEFVLALPSERCSVEIREDSNADPLSLGYRDFIGEEARELVEQRREQLGYRVRRERKFVCTPRVEPAIRAWVEERGKQCVIHTIGS